MPDALELDFRSVRSDAADRRRHCHLVAEGLHRRAGHCQDHTPGATLERLLATTGGWWHPDAGLVELTPAEQLIVRRASLCGVCSGVAYVLAESLVVPDRFPGVDAERLMLLGASLGRLLAAGRLESHREVLQITAVRAGATADHLGVAPSATLACRTYRVVLGRRGVAVVTGWLAPGRLAAAALRGHRSPAHGAACRSASHSALVEVEEERPSVGCEGARGHLSDPGAHAG